MPADELSLQQPKEPVVASGRRVHATRSDVEKSRKARRELQRKADRCDESQTSAVLVAKQ